MTDKDFGKILKQVRKRFRCSTKRMAELLKIDENEYEQIESGEIAMTVGQIDTIANFFGLPILYFFDEKVRLNFKKMNKNLRVCKIEENNNG